MKTILRLGQEKTFFKLITGIFLFACMLLSDHARSQTITSVTVSSSEVCAGSNITVNFTVTNQTGNSANWFTTGTTYSFWLSDAAGNSFLTGLGSFTNAVAPAGGAGNTASLQQSVTIPAGTAVSSSYRISVTAISPTVNGPNPSPYFTVRRTNNAFAGNNTTIFRDQSVSLGTTAVNLNSYSWVSSPAGFSSVLANPTVTPNVTTTYTLTENAGACGTASNPVTVTVVDNLTITKQLISATPTKPGDAVTYSISYSNLNPTSAATNVNLADILPGVSLFSYTSSSSSHNLGTATHTVVNPNQSLTWPVIVSLPANSSGTLTVNGRIGRLGGVYSYDNTGYYISTGSSTQTINNSATISNASTPAVTSNTVGFNVSQYCGINMPATINGSIHTSTSSDFFYLVDLQNTGNIRDRFALSSNTPGTGDVGMISGFETLSGSAITQTPWLAPGETYSFLIHFVTPGGTPPNKWNYTTITATSQVCNITANTVCSTFVYNGAQPSGADMIINKTASVSNIIAGLGFSYTLTAQNLASKSAKNISIIDTLPANVTYVGYSGASAGFSTPTYNSTTREFRVNYPTNNYRNTDNPISITINVMTACGSVPSVTNKAYVTNTEGDQQLSNNEKSVVVTVDPNEATPQNFAVGICEGQSTTLTPPGTLPANRGHKWYDAATGGNLLANAVSYTTPALSNNTTYWVTQYNQIDPACESYRAMVTVSVTKDITINMHPANQATCTNASFSVAASNGGTLNMQWQYHNGSIWQNVPNAAPYSGVTSNTLTITGATSSMDGYQYRCYIQAGTCFNKTSNAATLTVKKTNTWLGVNSNWLDAQNWCPSVPTTTTDVTIPNAVPSGIYPVITSTGPVARTITIESAANISINTGGQLEVYGDLANTGTITNNGTLSMRGTGNSTFPGAGTVAAMSTLELNKQSAGNTATLNKDISISTELKPTSGTLALSNFNITLTSDATKTAYVSAIGTNASITYAAGRFVIERYISQTRRWQLLSVPANTETRSIRQTWQENGGSTAGYGVNITGPGGSPALNGLDANSVTPSMKYYSPSIDSYVPVTNTLTTALTRPEGYYVYVYGDRSAGPFGAPGTATTLRSTGKLYIGRNPSGADNPPNATLSTYGWMSVGNPFACPIDFELWRNGNANIGSALTVWDPSVTNGPDGYASGVYQTITFNASTISVTPGGGYYINGSAKSNAYIQSGQAFYIERAAGTINQPFYESHKVPASRQTYREAGEDEVKMFSAFVYHDQYMQDGNRVIIGNQYSNELDADDASKLTNPVVNFGMDRGPRWLSVETRNSIAAGDTIHYSMGGLWENNYQLVFAPQNMANPLLKAELVDRYKNTRTPISLSDSSIIDVEMDNNDASRAYDRFYVVFANNNIVVLPVDFVDVKAARNADRSVSIRWKVANEINITRYEVERSADGTGFTGILSNDAANANDYSKIDLSPLAFDNFYRIKAIGIDGSAIYSKTVKVTPEKLVKGILISPNPVKNGQLNMLITDVPAGNYSVQVFNQTGQLMHSASISLTSYTTQKGLNVGKFNTGIYHVIIKNDQSEIIHNETVLFE